MREPQLPASPRAPAKRGCRGYVPDDLATAGGPLAAGVLSDASGDYALLPPAAVVLLLLAIPTVLAAEYGHRGGA